MGNDINVKSNGLTQTTANLIQDQFSGQNKKEIKKAVKEELERMLANGEVSRDEAKAAMKFLKSDDLAGALARRNTVERYGFESIMYDIQELEDPKANELMKQAGLNVTDLFNTAVKYAGADYEISYTHLSKNERKMAENGELTSSEMSNIMNDLNEKIKANGGDKVLDKKEVKTLMEGLGLSVEKKFNIGKIILSALGLGAIGGGVGSIAKKTTVKTLLGAGGVSTVVTSGVNAGAAAAGAVGGAITGAAAGMVGQALRKEDAYGEQGGQEGGVGSATNKTEAKMQILGETASGKIQAAEEEIE